MDTIYQLGTDAAQSPSSYGGAGWRPRHRTHEEEARAGRLWGLFGVRSEVAPLREVLVAWPGEELLYQDEPNEQLMHRRVDLDLLRAQAKAVGAFYRSRGVVVHSYTASQPPPPNFIFMRDLFFMTPEGVVLGRMASEQRSGEERFAAAALASLGIPILMCPRGRAVFEGADALWIDQHTVLIGVGHRTNEEAFRQIEALLGQMNVTVLAAPVPSCAQHLLGGVTFVDRNLAAVMHDAGSTALIELLEGRGYECILFPQDVETVGRRAMNVVTLAPRDIAMPGNCPVARARFERAGVACSELEVSEYIAAAGALGCLTGIIRRDDSAALGS